MIQPTVAFVLIVIQVSGYLLFAASRECRRLVLLSAAILDVEHLSELFSFLRFLHSFLDVSEKIVVLVMFIQLNFKCEIEQIVFLSSFGNMRSSFQVASLIDLVRHNVVNDSLSERYDRPPAYGIVLVAVIAESALRYLHPATAKISGDAGFEFHQLPFIDDIVFPSSEQIFTCNCCV